VLRPGGRLGLCNWTPEGRTGDLFRALGGYAPPPPGFVEPPLGWGKEAHVRDLFAGTPIRLEFERDTVRGDVFDSGQDAVEFLAATFGPLIMLRATLEQNGSWDALCSKLAALYDHDDAAEYLVVLGRKGTR
jgi:hypothetical protein